MSHIVSLLTQRCLCENSRGRNYTYISTTDQFLGKELASKLSLKSLTRTEYMYTHLLNKWLSISSIFLSSLQTLLKFCEKHLNLKCYYICFSFLENIVKLFWTVFSQIAEFIFVSDKPLNSSKYMLYAARLRTPMDYRII